MKMKRIDQKKVFIACMFTAVSIMTGVLLWNTETGNFQYWARVGAVAIMWCILLLSFTPLRSVADIKVITTRADKAIVLSIVLIFFVITVTTFFWALANRGFGAGALARAKEGR